jgi:hypothetical protein
VFFRVLEQLLNLVAMQYTFKIFKAHSGIFDSPKVKLKAERSKLDAERVKLS